MTRTLVYVVNVDWFFLSHRLAVALAAQARGYRVHVATGLTGRRAELEGHGFVVHPLALDRAGAGLASAWRMGLGIWRVLRAVRPDLVHLVTIKPILFGGLAARVAGVPAVVAAVSGLGYVFLAHGWIARVRRRLIATGYRLVFGHPNVRVIFQNPDDRLRLMEVAGLPLDKTTMIRGSGVDLDRFAPRPWPGGVPVVVLASRLLVDKGVREFVAAAAQLRQRGSDARFVLVGQVDAANPASVPQAEVDAWARQGVVECWGQRSDMPEVLAQACLVVLPSYREGLPKVLLEAAACGRAVVTTDVPGCRDAIDPGTTGILVPARDADALALALQELLADPARCRSMGDAGRSLAERAFDVRHVARAHLALYEQMLAR